MTSTADRSRTRGASPSLLGQSLPQVNLLPPEVRLSRGLRVVKRWLAVAVVATLALCAAAFGASLLAATSARATLADAQARTAALHVEEGKYAEVPQVLNALGASMAAREFGMSTDIRWKSYFDAIGAVLPPDVSLSSFVVTAATPTTPPIVPADVLQPESVGQITFTGRSATMPDAAAWIDALESIPGFVDARVSSVTVAGNDDIAYYDVASSVQLTTQAYTQRFAATEGN